MAAPASASATQSPAGPGVADLEDSNVSSPLSEVDDGDTNDDDIERMQLDPRGDDGDNFSASGDERPDAHHDGSDSDSALSDAASDVHSDANDTEAETERLYDTPKNQRQRDVLVDQFNNGQVFEHTPSKLRRTTRAAGDHADDESVSGDDASVVSSHAAGDESPAKPATTNDTSVDEDLKHDSQERKRKRSPLADQSESDQPLRKRTGSVAAADADADEDLPMNEDDTPSAIPMSRQQSGGEDDESGPPSRRDTPAEAEARPAKKSTRSSLKRKGLAVDDVTADVDSDARDDQAEATAGDETEQPEDEPDVDEEADAAAKNIEEMERKNAAFKDWTHIEEMFSIFRDRLYKDRLRRLEEEELSLLADEPTHPEYLNMKKCIDDRLNKRIQEINTEYEYRMKAHARRAVAQRAQIWSQFYQAIREKRELALEKLNQQWYEVQSARRKAHSLPDYGLLFPKDPAQRVRNAIAYNTEVSTLAGLAKYEGFPSGPELRGASTSEVDADFSAIEQVRRTRHRPPPPPPPPVQAREEYHHGPPTFSRLGPAGEQFIKDTPWANPNHSAHKQYQQNHAQPGARPESSTAAGPTAQPANGPPPADVKAAFDGQPAARRSPAMSSRKSESPEMTRSKLNPASHPMKRVGSIPNLGRGPKTAAA
ncbi:transcriptional regulatory protein DEP1 [Purpureocillium lilacinum]|uniref:Transcriptional regulatory protein DEP1 n=1 Tax=Purpureocillium lilacinum TaxID=33203 RepID=A0A179H1U4_PURLI|nr:transcriptional regulatory protein DEP1 [Purpureocillium lilacinum]